MKSPSAFLSYSWDSPEHKDWVRTLATKLRNDGVYAVLDQWEVAPGDRLPEFMERSIRENAFVLVVCTPAYKRKSEGRRGGVGYEGDIMTGELVSQRNERKFIPLIVDARGYGAVPSWLSGKWGIDLSGFPDAESEYGDLLETLLGRRQQAPPIGAMPKVSAGTGTRALAVEATQASHEALPGASLEEPFQDVRILRVIVEDVTQPRNDGTPGSALYRVPFALSATPPSHWVSFLEQAWNLPPQLTSMHRPGILSTSGARVVLNGTTIDEVKKYHRDTLSVAVQEANRRYREHLAEVTAARRREAEAQRSHEEHVRVAAEEIKFD